MKSKELFIYANQIIIEGLEKLIEEFPKISTGEKSILTLEEVSEGIFKILINGFDDKYTFLIAFTLLSKIIFYSGYFGKNLDSYLSR